MARKSFTLQKLVPNVVVYPSTSLPASTSYLGSYVRYPSGSLSASADVLGTGLAVLEDNDSRLRSDGLLLPPILNSPARSGELLPYISFFDVEVIGYNETKLTWDAPLTDLSTVSDEDLVVATEIIIVYSLDGEPQTISDGVVLSQDNTTNILYHLVPSGKWAYYTLFVKFQSNAGDLYYEPAAKLSLLVPKNYESIDELYVRIPEYYRLLDGDMDEGYGGPLYRYLSIFGYELDKIKTIIDYLMVMKDPQVAHSQVLDVISQDLGIGLRVHELGPSRLRTLINIIGYLRRSEGTAYSMELAIQALTGSDVEVDVESKEVKVYAQRVNLLKDPNIDVLIAGVLDAGSPTTADNPSTLGEFSSELFGESVPEWLSDPNYDPNLVIYASNNDIYDGGSPSATGGTSIGTQDPVWTYNPDVSSGGSLSILSSMAGYIMVKSDDDLYFSMQQDPTNSIQDQIVKVQLRYGTTVVAESTTPIKIAGINYWKLSVIDGYENYIGVYIHIYVPSEIDASKELRKMLLEREIGGKFFNGDTTLGGWLVDDYTISDYRWYDLDDPDSSVEPGYTNTFSVYNSNYSKTRAVVHRLLSSYLPVTELTSGTDPVYYGKPIPNPKWTVTFNHIPGVPYA